MKSRLDYCKRLFIKAAILHCNMGENEKEELMKWMDTLGVRMDGNELLVDDTNPCKCENRSDVINMNDKNYCIDCLCIIVEINNGKKKKET